ncbi:Sigma-70 region 2 [Filimonas lacunae]|uniref:Sigma-70 region 2 n=1 Tax=Filimonas lacunae TaxID=477680 RepID=A0A173MPR2_9BACT|nr:RagB/SusD family nutrient uptake outer membrane protein [Filimonas lacunae]BAV09420.1 hypothetical protein FLA_5469 [Filimonas lacunae]SIS72830.1 Sigma-70 region 2 [Filimonas lacunae]
MQDELDYKQLYTLHYRKLFNYGKKFTTNIALIEDSIQDVFLDYWKRSAQMEQPQALTPYFFSAFRALYPILQAEINKNGNLIQNTGY